ncbi:MAG: hypothetical protein WCA89_09405 [Terracidiphilus sp.]
MKFLTTDGKIAEGVPLSDKQSELRDTLETYLHDKVCEGRYHGTYGAKPCRETANTIVPQLDDNASGALCAALLEPEPEQLPEPELDPTPVSQIETSPTSETTSQPKPESLPASTVPAKDDFLF